MIGGGEAHTNEIIDPGSVVNAGPRIHVWRLGWKWCQTKYEHLVPGVNYDMVDIFPEKSVFLPGLHGVREGDG